MKPSLVIEGPLMGAKVARMPDRRVWRAMAVLFGKKSGASYRVLDGDLMGRIVAIEPGRVREIGGRHGNR